MIWGVDLGTRKIAMVGLPTSVDVDLDPQCFTFEVDQTTRANELNVLARQFSERVFYTDIIFIEEPPKVKNMRTFLALAQTSGALLAVSTGRTYLIPVDTWKKKIIGRGGASKELVAAWLAEQQPELHQRSGGNQDLMDASCIALYGQAIAGDQ